MEEFKKHIRKLKRERDKIIRAKVTSSTYIHKANFLWKEIRELERIVKEKEKMREFEFVNRMYEECINDNGILKNEYGMISLPKRSTANSAGYDFFAQEDTMVSYEGVTYVKTGVKAKFPNDEMLMLCNRSSNPKKKQLVLINGVGIVDSDYYENPDNDGEICFAFKSLNPAGTLIKAGEKIGQGIFIKYGITHSDNAAGEREGGFGSTGV